MDKVAEVTDEIRPIAEDSHVGWGFPAELSAAQDQQWEK